MAESLESKIEKARAQLIMGYPFFAHLVMSLRNKILENGEEQGILTAATNGRDILYNRQWAEALEVPQIIGVIVHETLHVAHSHVLPWRRGFRDPKLWNIAGDYVVNEIIDKNGLKLPEGCLIDHKYANMSTEEVYREIEKNAEKKKVPNNFTLSGDLKDPTKDNGEGGGDGDDNNGGGRALTDAEQKAMAQEWEGKLLEAAQSAKMQGKMPAGMERYIGEITNPRIPWYEYLDNVASEVLRDDYAFDRPDRRFLQQGLYLPDLYNEGSMVAVAIDTSGSIGKADMELFLSETFGILASKNVTRVRLMCCDAQVTFDKYLTINSPIPGNLPGGGGTDFRPVFSRIGRSNEKPDMLIYMTDLCGTFPEEPEYPVIWVAHNHGNEEAPFGTQISFNPTTDEIEVCSAHGSACGMDFEEAECDEDMDLEPEEYQG